MALALGIAGARAQDAQQCAQQADDALRLACYDKLFRGGKAPLPPPPSALADAGPSASALVATLFTKGWELTPESKRGTFVVRTYLPNFVLPAHYSSSINRNPASPTHPAIAQGLQYKPLEAKIQVSLRTKVVEGLLLPDADLWFAYTQRSLWQVWNPGESSPFRSTDYQPEAIYVIPTASAWSKLPGGWAWRMTQFGLAHQSNGQSDPLSRSWNRVSASVAFDRGEFGLTAKLDRRLREDLASDDNPDLTRYIGNAEFTAAWLPGLSTASVTWRTHLRAGRGSLQFDWSYPVNPKQPAGLRWYAQLFTGYGETLLDYNHRQTSLGLGVTLFQF